MSHNSYVRPLGTWNSGQVVTHGELAALDAGQFKAINGDEGGTWAPASVITIGGAGLTARFVGVSTVDAATLNFDNAAQLSLNAGSFARFYGETTFRSGSFTSTQSGSSWLFKNGSTTEFELGAVLNLNGSIFFGATSSVAFQGPITVFAGTTTRFQGTTSVFTSQVYLQGPTEVSGALTLSGPANVSAPITLSGAGCVVERVVLGANANSTYSVNTADLVYIAQGTLTAPRTYYVGEAGAADGKRIRFHLATNSVANPITLKRESDGGLLCYLTYDPSGYIWTDVVRINGVWRQVAGSIHA